MGDEDGVGRAGKGGYGDPDTPRPSREQGTQSGVDLRVCDPPTSRRNNFGIAVAHLTCAAYGNHYI